MKFVRISADLKETNIQLKRIADCLDTYLRLAHHYNMTPPSADTSGPPPEVMYSTDEESAVYELEEKMGRLPREEPDLPSNNH